MHTDLDKQPQATGDRLRQLPLEMLPPYNWQEFKRRSRQRLPAARDRLDWNHAAVAATAVLVVGGLAVWLSGRDHVAGTPRSAWTADVARQGAPVGSLAVDVPPEVGGADPAVDPAAIEAWLANLPDEPVVVRVGTRAAVAGLEDRIAQVDDLLTSVRLNGARPDRLAVLQQERVRLMGSLAQVRYAEVVAAE